MTRSALAEVRKWARENGFQVGERGSLPAEVEVAYESRNLGNIVPEARHRRLALKIARNSKYGGSPAVLAAVNELVWDDLPMVVVELARMAREAL